MKKIFLIIILIIAGLAILGKFGRFNSGAPTVTPILCETCQTVLPHAAYFVKNKNPLYYKAFCKSKGQKTPSLCGYAFYTTDLAPDISGYGGPINLMVGTNAEGTIEGLTLISHSETPSYVENLDAYLKQFKGKNLSDSLALGKNIDGITQATITTQAVLDSICTGLKVIMKSETNVPDDFSLSDPPRPGIDVAKVKADLAQAGLHPQEAKYWNNLEDQAHDKNR